MKGRMDVLNLNKQRTSKSSSFKDVIRIETDDEREKENCEDISDCSDLVIDTRNKEAEMEKQSIKVVMSDEEDADMDDVDEDDEDDEVVPDLPVLSVILKEDDNALEYNNGAPLPKSRPDVEIEYEDDIEEEDYDSEDSMNIREMPPLSSRTGVEKADLVQMSMQTHRNQIENFDTSFINSNFFESSMLNFNRDSSESEKILSDGSKSNNQFNGGEDKTNDSVLLSIVYATINVPFSQVSKFLSAYNLSKSQLSVIRKVRRQVKNRLYAQNCRKRRVAHIKNLANELKQIKTEKEKIYSVRHQLVTRKKDLEKHYAELYDHVMKAVKEKCRSEDVEFINHSDEEDFREIQQQLIDERMELEEKKNQLDEEYNNLYKHVFKVISERNASCRLRRNPFNLQLCSMNIVDELAMLNKYYAKSSTASNETGDFDSSISIDGSGTSENKMNDFIDYESSVSRDGSRTEENTRDGLIDYESSMNDDTFSQVNETDQSNVEAVTTVPQNTIHNIDDIRLIDENGSRISEDSMKAWSEKSEDMNEDDSEDDEDDEDSSFLKELQSINDDLQTKKKWVQEQYTNLYNHILQVTEINEAEFLKAFMDYCITLLKVPGRDLCSIAFNKS